MLQAFQYRRLVFVALLVMAGFAWAGCRLYQIQIASHQRLRSISDRLIHTKTFLEPWRGEIRDRAGRVLAISSPVKTLLLNPAICDGKEEIVAAACAPIVKVNAVELCKALQLRSSSAVSGGKHSRQPILLRRGVTLSEWEVVKGALALEDFGFNRGPLRPADQARLSALRRKLVFAVDDQRRQYPMGSVLSHVLGFVTDRDSDSMLQGRYGIEKTMNSILAGQPGACLSRRDGAGNEMPAERIYVKPAADGASVVLTIDTRLQCILEQELQKAITNTQSIGASGIILHPRTGEILAAGAVPNFDPHKPGASASNTWPNRVFIDSFEPGSVFKLFALSAALDSGMVTLNSGIYCCNGVMRLKNQTIHDTHPHGLLTVRDCLAKSSNIGFAKVALALGARRYYDCITNFGFGRCTGAPFAAEGFGSIPVFKSFGYDRLACAAFGQGVGVTMLQLAGAVGAIANDGRLMRPMLVSAITSPDGRLRTMQPQVARIVARPQTMAQVREAMKAVVRPGGTATAAAMANHTLAAKTGTAQKSDNVRYLPGKYNAIMVGFFPADAPQLVLCVLLDEPQNGHLAGAVVAPVFREIAERSALCLGIPGDRPAPQPRPAHPQPQPAGNRLEIAGGIEFQGLRRLGAGTGADTTPMQMARQ